MAYFVDTRLGSTVAIVNGNGQGGLQLTYVDIG